MLNLGEISGPKQVYSPTIIKVIEIVVADVVMTAPSMHITKRNQVAEKDSRKSYTKLGYCDRRAIMTDIEKHRIIEMNMKYVEGNVLKHRVVLSIRGESPARAASLEGKLHERKVLEGVDFREGKRVRREYELNSKKDRDN